MVTDHFREVIDNVLDRHVGVQGRREAGDIVHATEMNEGLALQSLNVDKLADVAETEIVNQGAAKCRRVARGKALVIIVLDLLLGLAGKLLATVPGYRKWSAEVALCRPIIIHDAAQKQAVVCVSGEVVIELRDIGILACRQWRRESVSHIVEAIADRVRIGIWILAEESARIGSADIRQERIWPRSQRASAITRTVAVHAEHLSRVQCFRSARGQP